MSIIRILFDYSFEILQIIPYSNKAKKRVRNPSLTPTHVWKLTTEGASHQPEGLWPEGWGEAPEVANDTHAQHTWVGVTFMH